MCGVQIANRPGNHRRNRPWLAIKTNHQRTRECLGILRHVKAGTIRNVELGRLEVCRNSDDEYACVIGKQCDLPKRILAVPERVSKCL